MDAEVIERRVTCTGAIVFRVALDKNGQPTIDAAGSRARCVLCKDKTSYFCLGCRHWLCGPGKQCKTDTRTCIRFVEQMDGTRILFRESCWNRWHEGGLISSAASTKESKDVSIKCEP